MEDVAKKVGTESRYLKELVTVTIGTIGTNGTQFSRLLTIDVYHTSKEEAKKMCIRDRPGDGSVWMEEDRQAKILSGADPGLSLIHI